MKKLQIAIFFLVGTRLFGQVSEPLSYKKYILGDSPSTLSAKIQEKNSTTGSVTITGDDLRAPTIPFTFIWGDNTTTPGFFPTSHSYSDKSKNYLISVIANYSGSDRDTVKIFLSFSPLTITPGVVDPKNQVFIKSEPTTLPSRLGPPISLTGFSDATFTKYTRAQSEYILSVASAIGYDFVNQDVYLFNGKFEQNMLRDANFGGAYSLWFTDPVAFGVGDVFVSGDIDFSSLTHEMGHNYTLNMPGNFYFGGRIDGNANAIYSESMAQMFAHAVGYDLVNNYQNFGFNENVRDDLRQKFITSVKQIRQAYDRYLANGKPFSSWNDPVTPVDETFDTFMTIAYKFLEHAELDKMGYRTPFKRMATNLQQFNSSYAAMYDQHNNNSSADAFRATLMVAALSYAFNTDLRSEFASLNFPINNAVFSQLVQFDPKQDQTIAFSISDKTFGSSSFNPGATSSSGLPVSYSTSSDKISFNGSNISILKPGRLTLRASQSGNSIYNAATPVDQSFCINPAKPEVTTNNASPEAPVLTSSATSGNQWYLNGTALSGQTNASVTVTAAGIYTVKVTVDDCVSEASEGQTYIVTADQEAIGSMEMELYPNPAKDKLMVRWHSVEQVAQRQITVFDLLGRELERFIMTDEELMLDISNLSSGTYILRGQHGVRFQNKRLVKE